ncbi:TetR family transcriptional regulator [Streptomyces sp. NPDC001380]|uniref:TetR/AcrR family transcriptional regulator n=1 Tax=Streptomyces sp. NPDC001380 TaxID=3364566 RepID=UPI0036A549FD
MTTRPRAGRRPGDSGTREAILDAARRRFAELGYDRTTLRGIAADAGVDVALVSHYFGPKQRLFAQAASLPFDPALALPGLLDGPREDIGRRLARHVLETLDSPTGRRRMTGLIRAAASERQAADEIRERVSRELLVPLAEGLGAPDAPLRASLAGSQIVGLVMARHVVGLEPLTESASGVLVDAVAPVLQHYLTGPLAP